MAAVRGAVCPSITCLGHSNVVLNCKFYIGILAYPIIYIYIIHSGLLVCLLVFKAFCIRRERDAGLRLNGVELTSS